MTYATEQDNPMTDPIVPKPVGYVAKDEIYKILKRYEEHGKNIDDIDNEEIAEDIELFWGFREKPNTISSYKSQYKKSTQFRPEPPSTSNIRNIIIISKKIEKVLRNVLDKADIDKETLRSIINATLDTLEDEK